ncbi:hypothetical protein N0V83_000574 [Neocucurbitaria cava]|uniref:Heterokaryon incompatibility domain-containing protein n=1 Tax=Neocucurbitaria cava TaxID=798079 RepID=A0A9W8YGW2_9PLEO|nr:hypothetical protein N0V83_000574 [Neocucurbitaria cava]
MAQQKQPAKSVFGINESAINKTELPNKENHWKITLYPERWVTSTRRPSAKPRPVPVLLPHGIKHPKLRSAAYLQRSMRFFEPFEYPPLPGPGYIRLLHLEPPSDDPSQLKGSLKVHKLDAHCDYEAISYTWGDHPGLNLPLYLNNQLLRITGNLYVALMAYSYPDRVRVLWADAICINQANPVEKGQQVSIMSDIYSKARSVQVWLALASTEAKEAMDFMANLALQAKTLGTSDEVDKPRICSGFPSVNIPDQEARDLIHAAVEAHVDYLFSRSWFNRVWVVQEVILATKLVVSCGHANLDWTSFARSLETLRGAMRQVPLGEDRLRLDGLKPAWGLVRLRDTFRWIDQLGTRDHHLMTNIVANKMSNNACTDDRDRVYAMLSMTNSPYSMIPDYEKTVAEAYTEFTRKYSPNTQLYWAGLCRRQPKRKSRVAQAMARDCCPPPTDINDRDYIPSWVPEFRPELNLAWASPFTGHYTTASLSNYWFLPHPDLPNVMLATGTIFDVLGVATSNYAASRAPYCMQEPGFYFALINELAAIACLSSTSRDTNGEAEAATSAQEPQQQTSTSSEPPWLILAKTVTGGVSDCSGAETMLLHYRPFKSLNHLEPGSLRWLTAIWDSFARHCLAPTGEIFQKMVLKGLGIEGRALSPDAQVAEGFLNYLANIFVPNRLFVTTKGYIGLAARNIRSGDFVAMFNGDHMPYVVRSTGRVEYKGHVLVGAIQIIGPCYVHGIMKGEIFDHRDSPDFSTLKWTRYDDDPLLSLEGWLMMI